MTRREQSPAGPDSQAAALSEQVRLAVWVMARRMRTEVQAATDVPQAQQAVLALLDLTPGMTSAELARAEHVRPQSMNKTVAALRESELVTVCASPVDGRRQELHLSPSGAQLLARIRSLRGDWLTERVQRDLNDSDREALARAAEILRGFAASD